MLGVWTFFLVDGVHTFSVAFGVLSILCLFLSTLLIFFILDKLPFTFLTLCLLLRELITLLPASSTIFFFTLALILLFILSIFSSFLFIDSGLLPESALCSDTWPADVVLEKDSLLFSLGLEGFTLSLLTAQLSFCGLKNN